MRKPKYKRILLKLSGEVFAGKEKQGIDANVVDTIAKEIKAVHELGVQLVIVIGGGNIYRGIKGIGDGLDRTTADYMGMLATLMNAMALQNILEQNDVPTRVQTSFEVKQAAELFIRRRAIRHLEKGRVVILAGGTGNPYFTTDTTASLRAAEVNAEVVLKATKVDGVYDADPVKNPQAKKFDKLTYMEVLNKQLKVMDATAISMCMENKIPMVVFNLQVKNNIQKVVCGETIGTIITA